MKSNELNLKQILCDLKEGMKFTINRRLTQKEESEMVKLFQEETKNNCPKLIIDALYPESDKEKIKSKTIISVLRGKKS